MEYLLIGILLIVLYQDIRFRGVHWIFFPLLMFGSFFVRINDLILIEYGMSLVYLISILFLLTIYLTVKNGQFTNFLKGYFSLGDVLFLLAVIPLFSFTQYVFFFIFSTLFTLVAHLIISQFDDRKTIPFAGYASIPVVIILLNPELLNLTELLG